MQFNRFDLVVDCVDNPATRYCINDACVKLGKPLVSGAAVGLDGTLSVFGYEGGPCYRCWHPTPPPRDSIATCSEAGVLGAVPGTIGCLQALEALKVAMKFPAEQTLSGRLFILDAAGGRMMTVRRKGRDELCVACGARGGSGREQQAASGRGNTGSVEHDGGDGVVGGGDDAGGDAIGQGIDPSTFDYESFCGPANECAADLPAVLPEHLVATPAQLLRAMTHDGSGRTLILDVRDPAQFDICSLPGSLNIPLDALPSRHADLEAWAKPGEPVFVLCRRGVLSSYAVQDLAAAFPHHNFFNVRGGLRAWASDVDPNFPIY
jgi:adenylyltransferase/sulfurtransferase